MGMRDVSFIFELRSFGFVQIVEQTLPHHPDSEKFRGSSSQSHCSPPFPQETLRFIETENLTPQHHSDIGRTLGELGLYRVFWQMSVIAVFPQKTGNLMFVGFDSQNTFGSFLNRENLKESPSIS